MQEVKTVGLWVNISVKSFDKLSGGTLVKERFTFKTNKKSAIEQEKQNLKF